MRTITHARWEPWHLAAGLVLAAVGVLVTFPAWSDIYAIAYSDEEQSHIFLVPIVSAWMFLSRRVRLRSCPPTGTFVGPLIVLASWAAFRLGFESNVQAAWHLGAVGMVVGCLLTALGKNVLFRFLPAFLVLVLLVPIPGVVRETVSQPLQTATAAATQAVLEVFGVGVRRMGNVLTINGHDIAVAEACNGMRMVFALVLVSYAFAFSMPLQNWVRLTVLAFSPAAALVCNILRLLPTVLVYGYGSPEAGGTFHDISAWLMLPLAFLLLMGVIRVLQWALIPVMRYNLAYQ